MSPFIECAVVLNLIVSTFSLGTTIDQVEVPAKELSWFALAVSLVIGVFVS